MLIFSRAFSAMKWVSLCSMVFAPALGSAVQGIVASSPTTTDLAAMDVALKVNSALIAVAGAALALIVSRGKYVFKLPSHVRIVASVGILILGAVIFSLIWDQLTIANQLRNEFLNLDPVLPGTTYFVCFVVGLFCSLWVAIETAMVES